jgi:transcriptional regulator with XRE-family HTH domain
VFNGEKGDRLKVRTNMALLIKNRGSSLRKLNDATGINISRLSYMQRGAALPTDKELEAICLALQVTADMIYPDPETQKVLAE